MQDPDSDTVESLRGVMKSGDSCSINREAL